MFREVLIITGESTGDVKAAEYTGEGQLSEEEVKVFHDAATEWFRAGDFSETEFERGRVVWSD